LLPENSFFDIPSLALAFDNVGSMDNALLIVVWILLTAALIDCTDS
jgi:hypothetical protein